VKELQRGGDRLKLINGRIIHGWQFLEPSRRDEPTAYYDRASGIGRLLQERSIFHTPHLRVGVIGLGAGTLAAYGSQGDSIRFYEIDPAVIQMSSGPDARFTFITDSKATVTIVPGDARLSLQREADRGQLQHFDVLAVDAFSSDAIPVHLVTREALALYLRHLRNRDSVLAFHISNNCVDLKPVLGALSAEENLSSVVSIGKGSEWILLSKNGQMLQSAALAPISSPLETKKAFLWTDDYSNLTQVLR
jgi:spermidine synthase